MVITRISDFGFKLTQGSYSIAVNPPLDKKDASATFGADLVLLSASASGFDSAEHFIKSPDETFVIDSPGEYEKDQLFIHSMNSTTNYRGVAAINTCHYFSIDGIDVLILGAHEPATLPNHVTELVDNVDVLILPVTGDGVMDVISAHKLSTKLEAKVVLPAGSTNPKDPNIQAFLQESSHHTEITDKINLKSTDIPEQPVVYVVQ